MRSKQQKNSIQHYRTKSLEPLLHGGCQIADRNASGTVVEENSPRSYTIQTPSGHFCRNDRHVISLPTATQPSTDVISLVLIHQKRVHITIMANRTIEM